MTHCRCSGARATAVTVLSWASAGVRTPDGKGAYVVGVDPMALALSMTSVTNSQVW